MSNIEYIPREVDRLVLREKTTPARAQWLLVNCENLVTPEEVKKLKDYLNRMLESNCNLRVEYEQKPHGYGRIYALESMSMQGLNRNVRGLLAAPYYMDVDITNCHPVILIALCEKYGWRHSALKAYVEDRETMLQMICESTSCKRWQAKILMLSLTFGGTFKGWLKRQKLNPAHMAPKVPFVERYAGDMDFIKKKISEQFAYYPVPNRDADENEHKEEVSRMSMLLQDMENEILKVMRRVFKRNGYVAAVMMYDGMMVEKKKDGDVESILRKCEKAIGKKFGWTVDLEIKPVKSIHEKTFLESKSG